MSHHEERTLLSPEVNREGHPHHSRSKDITVLNDNCPPRGKSLDNRHHVRAHTRVQREGLSRRREAIHAPISPQQGRDGDRELIKYLVEDNQWLHEALLALAEKIAQTKDQEDHESYTNNPPPGGNMARTNPVPQRKEGQGENRHDLGKKSTGVADQDVEPQGSSSQRVSAFLRIGDRVRGMDERPLRRGAVDRPRPPRNRSDDDLRHFILDAVQNHGKGEARKARDLARKALGKERQSTFTLRITDIEPPLKFSMPKYSIYDGKSDLTHHVRAYDQPMTLWESNKSLLCRCFAASLGETALKWYYQLPPGSINSYRALTEQLCARFIASSQPLKGLAELMSLRQKQRESLREYSKRYWDLHNEIKGDWPQVAIASFGHGLIPDSPLYNDLIMEQPTSLDDLICRTEKYSRLEEYKIQRSRRSEEKLPSFPASKRKREPDQPRGKPAEVSYRGVNTVFTEPIYKVTSKIKDKPFFKWPRVMPSDPSRRDPDKYCSYHKDHGHLIEKCKSLKFFLEDLVKKGHIAEFVKEAAHKKVEQIPAELRTVGIIDVIHGVLDPALLTGNSIRHSFRKVQMHNRTTPQVVMSVVSDKRQREGSPQHVSFSDKDLQGVETPHNDALVITFKISTWDVKKVLVDPSSSSEIMYGNLYRSLNLPQKDIVPVSSPVFSFSGEAVWPVGRVRLPIRIGLVQSTMKFLIVDINVPYNAIMGRNWLGAIKAMASPFHQKLKFPSVEGIVEVRGDQEQARMCFFAVVRRTDARVQTEKARK